MTESAPFGAASDEMSDEEKTAIVESLVDEMRRLFHDYVNDRLPYDELSFEMFDTLQTVHALATGALVVEYEDDFGDGDDDFLTEQPTGQPRRQGRGSDGN